MPTTDRTSSKSTLVLTLALGFGLVMSVTAAGKTVLLKNAPGAVQKTIAVRSKKVCRVAKHKPMMFVLFQEPTN